MKAKKYSKQLGNKSNSSSMLLKRQSGHRPGYVPLRLNPHTQALDLSHHQINTLSGIDIYKELQILNISGNCLSNFEQLSPLRTCKHLKQLVITGNPFCSRINYRYVALAVLQNIEKIDGVFVGQSGFKVVSQLQEDLGERIVKFYLQKCRIGAQILKNSQKNNATEWEPLRDQLSQIIAILRKSQQAENLVDLNWELKGHFPLSTISIPLQSEHDQEVTSYFLQKIITEGASYRPQFVTNLLNSIDVVDEIEEQIMKKDPKMAVEVLKMELMKQSESYRGLRSQLYQEQEQKHFTSAQTALDSNDRYRESPQPIHFALDKQYMQVLTLLLAKQCQYIKNKIQQNVKNEPVCLPSKYVSEIENYEQKDEEDLSIQEQDDEDENENEDGDKDDEQEYSIKESSQQNKQYLNHFSPQREEKVNYFTFNRSPQKIYNNPIILHNLLQVFTGACKKIVFNKIKTFKSDLLLQHTFNLFQQSLHREIYTIRGTAWRKIKEEALLMTQISQHLENKKLRRLFLRWKEIKKKRIKIWKKLVVKKSKADHFMASICLAKWKMNTRATNLQRMASEALLKPQHKIMPVSKKGVELAYLRTKKQLRL